MGAGSLLRRTTPLPPSSVPRFRVVAQRIVSPVHDAVSVTVHVIAELLRGGRDEERTRGMREGRGHQHPQLVGELPLDHLNHGHGRRRARGRNDPLRLARGAPGVDECARGLRFDLCGHQGLGGELVGQGRVVVTDIVRAWLDVWHRAGGDTGRTPYLKKKGS